MLNDPIIRKRMTLWREIRWYLAQRCLGFVITLAGPEMTNETVARFMALQESFQPDDSFTTIGMRELTIVDQFNSFVEAEVLTEDPSCAHYAVVQVDGHVRLVVEALFARNGDIVHHRGDPAFDQAVRYWRIDRSEDATRVGAGDGQFAGLAKALEPKT